MCVRQKILEAESLLPGVPVKEGADPRWQAILAVSDYIECEPEPIWEFIRRWGGHPQENLRTAIATCLLEELLKYHCWLYFDQVEQLALAEPLFGDMFLRCWQLGQAEEPRFSKRFRALRGRLHEAMRNQSRRDPKLPTPLAVRRAHTLIPAGAAAGPGRAVKEVSPVTRFYVQPAGPRPDFRLVLAFVWGDADCDTDVNSHNPVSREWTELYAQNLGRPDEVFAIEPATAEPLVLEVKSSFEWLAAAVAHLLASSTGGGVAEQAAGPFRPAESVLTRVGKFDVAAAWERFRTSPFQRATPENPNPDLEMIGEVAAKDLIGLWSRDALYHPMSQSDEVLVFKPDGTGFLEFSNPVPTFADLFRWTVDAPGRLRLKGYQSLYVGDGDGTPFVVREYPSDLDGVFAIQVQVEDTDRGRPMRVLHFSERPRSGIPDTYGFCGRDTTRWAEPDFSWIQRRPADPDKPDRPSP